MLNRARKPVLWSAGVGGIVSLLVNGPDVSVRARTAFRFADFGLSVPRVAVVLSVEDTIRLETDLPLRRSS